ncbi:MAG: DUF2619 domain-containing protein [bacterium]|jgi:hypothetical protein
MENQGKLVIAMALTRLLAGSLELTGAFLMLAFQRVDQAFRINALLGMVGPVIFLVASALGFAGLLGRIAPQKVFLLLVGIALILLSSRS